MRGTNHCGGKCPQLLRVMHGPPDAAVLVTHSGNPYFRAAGCTTSQRRLRPNYPLRLLTWRPPVFLSRSTKFDRNFRGNSSAPPLLLPHRREGPPLPRELHSTNSSSSKGAREGTRAAAANHGSRTVKETGRAAGMLRERGWAVAPWMERAWAARGGGKPADAGGRVVDGWCRPWMKVGIQRGQGEKICGARRSAA